MSDRAPSRIIARLAFVALAVGAAACTTPRAAGGLPSITSPPSARPSSAGPAFAEHGVSFSYPARWRPVESAEPTASMGDGLWAHSFALDGRNIVTVAAYRIATSMTDANVEAAAPRVRAELENLVTQAGGSLVSGPDAIRMAELPALRFVANVRSPAGRKLQTRLVLAFDGTTEYFVGCQYDGSRADALIRGCDRIVSTFAVEPNGSQG